MDGDLGLQLGDPPMSGDQLGVLTDGLAGELAASMSSRRRQTSMVCTLMSRSADLGDPTPSSYPVKAFAAKLGGMPLRHRADDHLVVENVIIQQPDSADRGGEPQPPRTRGHFTSALGEHPPSTRLATSTA
jgi:hypothetical protein